MTERVGQERICEQEPMERTMPFGFDGARDEVVETEVDRLAPLDDQVR